MKHFTSTARKDGRWWVVQCDQEPGALSQVARLDQAAEQQREAISMVTDIPEGDIEVEIVPALGKEVERTLAYVQSTRAEGERLQREASAEIARLAARLVEEEGLSLRDTGFALGVSHQRAAQLIQLAHQLEQVRREIDAARAEVDNGWLVAGDKESDEELPKIFPTKSEAEAFARAVMSKGDGEISVRMSSEGREVSIKSSSGTNQRSAKSGRFVSKSRAARHPKG